MGVSKAKGFLYSTVRLVRVTGILYKKLVRAPRALQPIQAPQHVPKSWEAWMLLYSMGGSRRSRADPQALFTYCERHLCFQNSPIVWGCQLTLAPSEGPHWFTILWPGAWCDPWGIISREKAWLWHCLPAKLFSSAPLSAVGDRRWEARATFGSKLRLQAQNTRAWHFTLCSVFRTSQGAGQPLQEQRCRTV